MSAEVARSYLRTMGSPIGEPYELPRGGAIHVVSLEQIAATIFDCLERV